MGPTEADLCWKEGQGTAPLGAREQKSCYGRASEGQQEHAASDVTLRQLDADATHLTTMPDRRLTTLHGPLPVVLPDARILGVVHDVVLDAKAMRHPLVRCRDP